MAIRWCYLVAESEAVANPFNCAMKSASIGTNRLPCPAASIAAKLFFTYACKGFTAPTSFAMLAR